MALAFACVRAGGRPLPMASTLPVVALHLSGDRMGLQKSVFSSENALPFRWRSIASRASSSDGESAEGAGAAASGFVGVDLGGIGGIDGIGGGG